MKKNKPQYNVDYIFDLETIMDYVFNDNDEKNNETEITESYVQDEVNNELVLTNKILRESKGNDNTSKSTIRYDLLKMFISSMMTMDNSFEGMTLGEAVIVNTMSKYGMIKKVNG